MKHLYKVLNKDLTSPYKWFRFEIGREYHCSDFDPDPEMDCSRGFYAVPIDGVPYAWKPGRILCECTVWGREVVIDENKQRYEYIRLGKRLTKEDVVRLALAEESRLGYKLSEVLYPVNPLKLRTKPVGEREKELLQEWISVVASVVHSVSDSVWDSVWASLGASVRDSIRASLCASVRDSLWASLCASVWDSIRASVWDSVWAYISSLFPGTQDWRGIDHEPGVNPFQPGIDLWRSGFIPSFDGTTWRLHQGKDAKIVYEMEENK
jgi:hypothetical protein